MGALQPATTNSYLSIVQIFLEWAARRYIPSTRTTTKALLANTLCVIEGAFEASRLRGKAPARCIGLTQQEIKQFMAILSPTDPRNPFRTSHRIRNLLICETLYETGIRRGELLKLKVEDVTSLRDGFYLNLVRRPDDKEDWRLNEPAQKTLPRIVAITRELYELMIVYIRNHRRPKRQGRPIKLSHSYLFVSERGFPLSESQVNYIIDTVEKLRSPAGNRAHPHAFRHSFCTMFLEHCAGVERLDEEASKDRLRQICGWAAGSTMPERYTANRLQAQANIMNRRRLEIIRANGNVSI
ncbi:MAG: site-specific integrase [Nitrospira sp.]|nr:site-specific integrase [Nitrospira sp.]